MTTQPLPFSSGLLVSGSELTSEAAPSLEPGSAMQSLPPHVVSQNRTSQTHERAQSWPIDVSPLLQQYGTPPPVRHRVSDIQHLPQLAEDVSISQLNARYVAGTCDLSVPGEVSERLPGAVHLASDEVGLN